MSTKIISISIDASLKTALDDLVNRPGKISRSKIVCDALKEFLAARSIGYDVERGCEAGGWKQQTLEVL